MRGGIEGGGKGEGTDMMFTAGRFGNVVSDDSFLSVAFFSFFGCVSFSFTRNKRERNELNKK